MARHSKWLRRADPEFFDLFERAGANIVQAADALDRMLGDYPDSRELVHEIQACEETGDEITHDVIRRLQRGSRTPVDREDIIQLASSLDDVVDYVEEVADYLGLFKIEAPMEHAQQLAGVLLEATRELSTAIPQIRTFADISRHTAAVHRLENEGDRITREAVASLFEGGIDPMVVIRWKDIFERLENAIDAAEKAAYILEGIMIKRS
jgi:predicted phosphate transport protein (TIGR00153 family)